MFGQIVTEQEVTKTETFLVFSSFSSGFPKICMLYPLHDTVCVLRIPRFLSRVASRIIDSTLRSAKIT